MKSTYSIVTDKLKFWPEDRLPKETYDRARRAGFTFWHGSKCFAGKWSTQAEDLVLELGGEIEQDDAPDDVESRVERFSKYAVDAQAKAENSEEYLNSRANTERRKRLAINSMEKGIDMARHWQQRIEGAIRNAQYKERPDVIARRIEGLEKSLRKFQREQDRKNFHVPDDCYDRPAYDAWANRKRELEVQLNADKRADKPWTKEQMTAALDELRPLKAKIFHMDKLDVAFKSTFDWAQRWIDHINLRLQYERASLEAAGGIVGGVGAAPMDKEKFQVGGAVETGRDGWRLITKVNKRTVEVFDKNCHWKHYWKVDRTEIGNVMTPEQVKAQMPHLLNCVDEFAQNRKEIAAFEEKYMDRLNATSGRGDYSASGYDDKVRIRAAVKMKLIEEGIIKEEEVAA